MKNIPDENQLEQLLESVPPTPGIRIDTRLAAAPWTRRAVIRRRNSAFASLAVLVLAALVAITPQGRALAYDFLHFFTRAGSDTLPYTPPRVAWVDVTPGVAAPTMTPLPSMAPFAADCGDFPSPKCSIEQIRQKVDFAISELGTIPSGFYFIGATGGPDRIFINYDAEDHSGGLVLFESPWTGSPEQTAWPVGASAVVESVQIGNVTGEYVKGSFMSNNGQGPLNWDPNLVQTLRWMDKGVLFEMQYYFGSIAKLGRDDLVSLAASLTTKSVSANLPTMPATTTPNLVDFKSLYPLTIAQAKAQAGFHLFEPANLPEALFFVGLANVPEHNLFTTFYLYHDSNLPEGQDGLTVAEQSALNNVDCELCGFVIGNIAQVETEYRYKVVGENAIIETVKIGSAVGEYVEGAWEARDDTGMKWWADPYLKVLRWQANGMAFELSYFGMEIEKTDMIAIAESMK